MASTEVNNVDHRAPDVRHLVYSMYRKMLTGYNDQANEIVDALPRDIVQEDADIYTHLNEVLRQQTNVSHEGDAVQGSQLPGPPPPPPPSFSATIPGRRLKTEIPERSLEPPAAIQNAMMTKDKKPFTYTPGGIDLSEIRSPRMARRINRNACAEEIPGLPAPNITNNQQSPPVEHPGNTHFSAMQSQLPAQVLPPIGTAPPAPPPPPPQSNSTSSLPPPPPLPTTAPTLNNTQSKSTGGRPPLGFDPNELFARVNKAPAYEPVKINREEPIKNIQNQPIEEKPTLQSNHQKPLSPKANEIGQNIYVPLQNEPGHIFVPQVTPKSQKEPPSYTPSNNQTNRAQLGSIYIPPVSPTHQEQNTPSPSTPYGIKNQLNSVMASSPVVETKQQAPWVTVYRTPQSSVPWANREPESSKPTNNTRIIPIQIEGKDSPKSTVQSPQSHVVTPPSFLQNPQMRPQNQINQHQQYHQQKIPQQQQQQQQQQQPQFPHTRVIPIQIEGGATITPQPRSPVGGINQSKFNPMIPQSPTPYSPAQEKEQRPQWAPVQPKTPKKEADRPQYQSEPSKTLQQQPQPEYSNYNTAGVPLSQLRKMQLSDDDRALMDKFKSQVERQGNDILYDENTNPRYRGGYIPSKVFKILDESVDEENYLHSESDPRYRGAVIPSRAFRMLQSMTDTAGDSPHQVPKSSQSRAPNSRPLSGAQFQQDAPSGQYVPPSEQQVQEPRKYTGGSIPSRSFKMLQAMTGQEVTAPNTSGSTRGRETPMSGINQWYLYPSPCPSPIDLYWGYYPPDPYFMYNFIPDWNAAYGSPYHNIYSKIPSFYPYQTYQNCLNDNDEQGYSSSDELAQYHANYWRNFMNSPFHIRPERCNSTPNYFLGSRECVTPISKGKKIEKIDKENKTKNDAKKEMELQIEKITEDAIEESLDEEDEEVEDEESETDTEEGDKTPRSSLSKIGGLQTLKSVSNVNIYSSESLESIIQKEDNNSIKVSTNEKKSKEKEEAEEKKEEEEEEEEEEISSSESLEELDKAPLPHQLSIILEESEYSDVENIKRKEETSTISESESCSTLNNGIDDDDDDDDHESDNDILDSESSVIVRLPLKLKFDRTKNDEEVTTVVVGDSEICTNTIYSLSGIKQEEENFSDSEDADVSVIFTIPTRSNSIILVEQKSLESREKMESEHEQISEKEIFDESKVDTEVTISLPSPKKSKNQLKIGDEKIKEENLAFEVKTEICERDFRSSTNDENIEVIFNNKKNTGSENKPEVENLQSWIKEENEKDCVKTEETEKIESNDSYKSGVGKLEEMISTFLETTKHKISNSMESSQENLEEKVKSINGSQLNKKDSQEESEEDDSGVTSDISNKQMNSETDADTESDYSELSKMTQFQRASTHSRLFKLLQEECEKCDKEGKEDAIKTIEEEREILKVKKQKLTLPLNSNLHHFEVESLSSSSGIASPSSPTISDRLVKELIHSLLNKKKGKKFKKIPLAKLHAAALRILQEEMDPYDTSPTSGEDTLFLSPIQKKKLHSSNTANFTCIDEIEGRESFLKKVYDDNYYDYLNYYNTWDNAEINQANYSDVVPSKAFRMLREQTMSPKPIEGFKARCPRISNKKNIPESITKNSKSIVTIQESQNELESLTFAEKQEKVSEVLEKYKKS